MVERFVRDEEAVGSSPVTSTNKNSPLNRYNAWFKGLFIFNICLYALLTFLQRWVSKWVSKWIDHHVYLFLLYLLSIL